ncbi:hypothetical protein EV424DRAFT_1342956 [Suillus variegatus]|nr:hypothetical protein EV424DRAFT_1348754 [Suillus variegatus]KAG1831600.1 hypothetical protein EV424DRAFT_1342956 [Suillus variegatus]
MSAIQPRYLTKQAGMHFLTAQRSDGRKPGNLIHVFYSILTSMGVYTYPEISGSKCLMTILPLVHMLGTSLDLYRILDHLLFFRPYTLPEDRFGAPFIDNKIPGALDAVEKALYLCIQP